MVKKTMVDKRPFDFLNNAIDNKVLIKLKNGSKYRGTLKTFDVHINVFLEDAEKLENDQVKQKLGSVFLRGDNITYISP